MSRYIRMWLGLGIIAVLWSMSQMACSCDPGLVIGKPNGDDLDYASEKGERCVPFLRGQVLSTQITATEVRSVTWSPDGTRFAAVTQNGQIRVWSYANAVLQERFLYETKSEVWAIAFAPDGKRVLTTGSDGVVRSWAAQKEGNAILPPSSKWKGRALVSGTLPEGDKTPLAIVGYTSDDGKGMIAWYNLKAQGSPLRFKEVESGVRSLSLSLDGSSVLVGLENGTLQWWLNANGSLQASLKGAHSDAIQSVSIHPSGNYASSSSQSEQISLWKLQAGSIAPFQTLKGHRHQVTSIAFSPNGKWLASLSSDTKQPILGELKLWDTASLSKDGAPVVEIPQPSTQPKQGGEGLAWHPTSTSNLVIKGSVNGSLIVWLMDGSPDIFYSPKPQSQINSLAYSPDNTRLAMGTKEGQFQIKETHSNGKLHNRPMGSEVHCVGWDPDGAYALAALANGEVKFWFTQSDEIKTYKPEKSHGAALSIATRRDRKALAIGYNDGTIIYSNPDLAESTIRVWAGMHDQAIVSLDWSHDGNLLATASKDRTVRIWKFTSTQEKPEMLQTWRAPAGVSPTRVEFHPNDSRLVVGLDGNKVALWHIGTKQWFVFDAPAGTHVAKWHTNGQFLYTAAKTGTDKLTGAIHLWDASNPFQLRHLKAIQHDTRGHTSPVTDFSLSSNSHLMYTSSLDKTYKLWRMRRGRIVRSVSFAPEPVSLAIRPDGRQLLLGTLNTSLQIWNMEPNGISTRRTIKSEHNNVVVHVAISKKGDRMFTAAGDQSFQEWDITKEPKVTQRYPGPNSTFQLLPIMTGMALNPADTFLSVVTGEVTLDANKNQSYKGQLSLWDLTQPDRPTEVVQGLPMIYGLAWHPSKDLMVVGTKGGGVIALHRQNGTWSKKREYPNLHVSLTTLVAFEPKDGELVASTGISGYIKVWRPSDGKVLYRLDTGGPRVMKLLFHPAGHYLAAGLSNGQIKLWRITDGSFALNLVDPELGKLGHDTLAHERSVTTMVWSVNGNTLYTGGSLKLKQWICAN